MKMLSIFLKINKISKIRFYNEIIFLFYKSLCDVPLNINVAKLQLMIK